MGGRDRPTSKLFSTAISPWQFVNTAVWTKVGIQIFLVLESELEYKDTDAIRRETERKLKKNKGGGEHSETNGKTCEIKRLTSILQTAAGMFCKF